MYHRFDGLYPSTSVTKELLTRHIHFFRSEGFNIVPLSHVVNTIKRGQSFHGKTLAITVDDAYRSTYEVAHSFFVKYKIPYTVFVNTEGIDRGLRDYMNWDQLRYIARSGLANLEAHGHVHAHMIRDMNPAQREKDIQTSVLRIYEETGYLPKYFAYPYGETHQQFMQELKNYHWNIGGQSFHFQAAFSTQSGPAGCFSSLFALPRFALNMNYGQVTNLFRIKMNSRPFPVKNFSPGDLAFCSSVRQKKFSLTSYGGVSLNGLNCFDTNGGNMIKKISSTQVEIFLKNPLMNPNSKDVRHRINCTLPDGSGQFFWLGKEFTILGC